MTESLVTPEKKSDSWVSAVSKVLRSQIFKRLDQLEKGAVEVSYLGNTQTLGEAQAALVAKIDILDDNFFWRLASYGSIGAAESYVKREWTSPNLVDVVRVFALNRTLLNKLDGGLVSFQKPMRALDYWRKKNSREGARSNIKAHYDLSNEMFRCFLDTEMMYSCAYYPSNDMSLEDAQVEKLRRICQKLNVSASDHVCEIGTGWGGFALFAAKNFGCKVTSVTISKNQYDYARERVRSQGLDDRITIKLQDYRDLDGVFDKVVSIEMIEAVGDQYLGTYLKKISSLLKPEGSALLQVITMNDQEYDRAVKETDFIKKYIFPGSFIPSLHRISQEIKKSTDLRMYHLDEMSDDYALTLRQWRERFFANKADIKKLGFDEEFIRLWDYYFCYCIGGFTERAIGSAQVVYGKPGFRGSKSNVSVKV